MSNLIKLSNLMKMSNLINMSNMTKMSNSRDQNIKSNQIIKFDANNCQEPVFAIAPIWRVLSKIFSVPKRNFTCLVLQSEIVTDTQYWYINCDNCETGEAGEAVHSTVSIKFR